jgi:hypothetical protein
MKTRPLTGNLLQSGVVFAAISFITAMGNMGFNAVMTRHLPGAGQYSNANSALNGLMPLLGLIPSIATFTVTHFIAHFIAVGDHARLQGLLGGCRRLLFRLTIVGSVAAVVAVEPLRRFFGYTQSLMLVTLACTLISLWASLATALCQGLAWFKRLALIGLLGMLLRVVCGWFITLKWPCPETAVLASTAALAANLILLFWREEMSPRGEAVSPWDREFVYYLGICAAVVTGNYLFTQGDLLIAQKYFPGSKNDAYGCAERLAVALWFGVAPLLTVLFTSRSGARSSHAAAEQLKLLALYAGALLLGAGVLISLRGIWVRILAGGFSPQVQAEAQAMVCPLAVTIVFVALLQPLAYWSLASRWWKNAFLYGLLGLGYWLTLLARGHTPEGLLQTMPVAAGIAFGVLFAAWWITLRRHVPAPGPIHDGAPAAKPE